MPERGRPRLISELFARRSVPLGTRFEPQRMPAHLSVARNRPRSGNVPCGGVSSVPHRVHLQVVGQDYHLHGPAHARSGRRDRFKCRPVPEERPRDIGGWQQSFEHPRPSRAPALLVRKCLRAFLTDRWPKRGWLIHQRIIQSRIIWRRHWPEVAMPNNPTPGKLLGISRCHKRAHLLVAGA